MTSFATFEAASTAFRLELSSHSQMTITFHPWSFSNSSDLASRATFRSNFSCQNPVLLFGVVATLQPSCLCQKHPWTKTAVRYLGNTMSGLPGRSLRCRRNLKPIAWSSRRSATSGEVFLERIRDMRSDRSAGLRKSTTLPF